MSPDATQHSPDVSPALPGTAGTSRSWRRLGRPRPLPRPRHTLGPNAYWLATKVGFRLSAHRNALVLRGIGGRHGPVLLLRGAPIPPRPAGREPAPAPRWTARRAGVALDVACLPLPHMPLGRPIWQLTAVEAHTAWAWANLVAPKGGRPSVAQIDAFVARIGAALVERGEHLAAVTVQVGSALPSAALRSLRAAGVEVRRTQAPSVERSAVALHNRFLRRHWQPRSEDPAAWELLTLERELQGWIRARNLEALTVL
ncbi:MAG: hypothetical protein JWQ48_1079 [Conexibacter sp.]|nr:hypothetical protein [Conexibacter sp.]